MHARRLFGAAILAGAIVILSGAPALATLKQNGIRCTGSALITGEKGKTYSIDANDATATLPLSGSAAWKGSVSPATHDHKGEVFVDLGFKDIVVGDWASKNEKSKTANSGVKKYDIPSWVPPFELRVGGTHAGKEGSCTGSILVKLIGDRATNTAVLAINAGLIAAAGLLVTSGLSKGAR